MSSRVLTLCAVLMIVTMGNVASAASPQPNETAARYLQVLSRRPDAGYLFDRFYNAWLTSNSIEQLEAFLTARAEKSSDPADKILLALFLEKEGQEIRALELYGEALKLSPDNPTILHRRAVLATFMLDFDAAIADLKQALARNPSDALAVKIQKFLGKVYLRNDQRDEALAAWQAMLEEAPNDLDLKEDIMELQLGEGLYENAAATCKELIAAADNNYRSVMFQLRLGDVYQRSDHKDKALKTYRETLKKVGSETWLEKEVLSQIGHVFRTEDDITGLKKYYEGLSEEYPNRIALMRRRAELLLESGSADEAVELYVEILRLTPGDRANRDRYIFLLIRAKKFEQACKAAEELASQYPSDGELLIQLAKVQNQAGKGDLAAAALEKYLEASDKSQFAYLRVARMLAGFGRKTEALSVYDRAAAAFDTDSDIKEARAGLLYALDKGGLAREALTKLGESGDADLVLRVAGTMSAHGDRQAAYDLLRSRHGDFADHYAYLTRLSREALALKKTDDAVAYCLQRLVKASKLTQLDGAVGDAHYAVRKAEKVEELTERLLADKTRLPGQTCLLTELLDKNHRPADADRVLAEALVRDGDSVLLVSQSFRLARRRENWTGAAEALKRLAELQPTRRGALLRRLVDVAIKADSKEDALKYVAEWKKLSPGSRTPHLVEARIHWDSGEAEKAIGILRSASLKLPDAEEILQQLARYYGQEQNYGAAERVYWKLLEKASDLSKRLALVDSLARAAEEQGKTGALIRHFETRMQTNRQSLFAPLAMARIYKSRGDYEERRRYLLKASELRSQDVSLLHEVARIEEGEGDVLRARATLKKAMAFDETPKTKQKLIAHYFRYGEEEKAYRLMVDLAGGKIRDPKIIEQLADALIANGSYGKAENILAKSLPEFPKNYRLRYLYAIALEEQDRVADSQAVYMELLDVDEEMPGVATKTASTGQSSYSQRFAGVMPSGAIELIETTRYSYRAYSYRRSSRYSFYSSSRSSSAVVLLPSSVDELPGYVLCHLGGLAGGMDDGQVEALVEALDSKGVRHASVKIKMVAGQGLNEAFLQQAHEDNPEDESILALWLLVNAQRGNVDLKALGESFENFRKKWPQLSSMMIIFTAIRGECDEQMLTEAIDSLGAIEKPNPWLVQGLVQGMSRTLAGREDLSEDLHVKLRTALLDLYPRMPKAHRSSPHMFTMIAGSLLQGGDYKEFIRFVDAELSSGAKIGSLSGMLRGRSSRGPLLRPLSFPPEQIPGFPDGVLGLFRSGDSSVSIPGMAEVVLDGAKLLPHVESVKNPVLKALVLHACGRTEQLGKHLDLLIEAPKPDLGHLALAAAWKVEQGQTAQAVKILQKARHLQMTQPRKKALEGAILAHAMELKEDQAMRAVAIDAALRLKRYRLDIQQRQELADAFAQLGRKKEAAAMEKTVARASGGRAAPLRRVLSRTDRIDKLIAEGKTDRAVKLLVQEFRRLAKQALPRGGVYMGSNSYEFRRIIDKVRETNLTKAFIKALDPGDESTNVRKLGELGYAHEKLGQSDQAAKAYRRALAVKADDVLVNMRMAVLLASTDLKTAREHILTASRRSIDTMGMSLSEELQRCETLNGKLDLAEILVELADSAKDKKRLQSHWIQMTFMTLEQPQYSRDGQVPHIFDVPADRKGAQATSAPASQPTTAPAPRLTMTTERGTVILRPRTSRNSEVEDESLDKFQKRRIEIYRRLCDVALQIPVTATRAFARKAHLTKVFGGDEEELLADAQNVILLGPGSASSMTYYVSFGPGSGRIPSTSPEMFLVLKLGGRERSAELDAFCAKLNSRKHRKSLQAIGQLRKLGSVDGQEFADVTADYLKSARRSPGGSSPDDRLCHAIRIWSETGKTASLDELVLDTTRKAVRQGSHNEYEAAVLWTGQICKSQGDQAGMAFLDQLRVIYIKAKAGGKASSQPTTRRATSSATRRRIIRSARPRSVAEQRIQTFEQLLGRLAADDETLWLALTQARKTPEIWEKQNGQFTSSRFRSDSDRLVDWELLKRSPLLKEYDEFWAFAQGEEGESLLGRVTQVIGMGEKKRQLLSSLETIQPATFGSGLLKVIVTDFDPDKMFGYLSERAEIIRAGDERRRKGLCMAVHGILKKHVNGEYRALSDQSKPFEAIYKQTLKTLADRTRKDFDFWTIEYGNTYGYARRAANLIVQVIKTDEVAAAEKIFEKAVETIQKYERRNGRTTTHATEIIRYIGRQDDPKIKKFLAAVQDKFIEPVERKFKDNPKDAKLRDQLIRHYVAGKNLEKLTGLYRDWLAAEPTARIHFRFVLSLRDIKAFPQRLEVCREGMKKYSDDLNFISDLKWAYLALEQKDKAVEVARKCMTLEGLTARQTIGIGRVFGMTEHYDEAVAAFKKGLALANKDHWTWDQYRLEFAKTYEKMGDKDNAATLARQLLNDAKRSHYRRYARELLKKIEATTQPTSAPSAQPAAVKGV